MNQLISTKEAADILGVAPKTLVNWRHRKLFGVPFFTADEKRGGVWYYYRERVEQLKAVYQKGILGDMYKLAWLGDGKDSESVFQKSDSRYEGVPDFQKRDSRCEGVPDFQKRDSRCECVPYHILQPSPKGTRAITQRNRLRNS